MPPNLPTELLQQILALALEDGSPARRQQTRHGFGLVCTSWHYSVQRWRELDVVGPEQAGRLAGVLRAEEERARSAGAGEGGVAEPARGAVRRMCLDLGGAKEKGEGVQDLLKLVGKLETLSVVLADDAAGWLADDAAGWLAEGIAEARGLRHLEVRGGEGRMDRPRVAADWLQQ